MPEIKATLRIGGDGSGAFATMRQVKVEAQALGATAIRISEQVTQRTDAAMRAAEARVARYEAELRRQESSRSSLGRAASVTQINAANRNVLKAQQDLAKAENELDQATQRNLRITYSWSRSAQLAGQATSGFRGAIDHLRLVVDQSRASWSHAIQLMEHFQAALGRRPSGDTTWTHLSAVITNLAASLKHGTLAGIEFGKAMSGSVSGVVMAAVKMVNFTGIANHAANTMKAFGFQAITTGSHIAGLSLRLGGMGVGLYSLSGTLSQIGSAIRGTFTDVLDVAGEFQAKMILIGAVVGEVGGQIQSQLSDLAINLSKTNMFGPTEIAGVVEDLVKGGLTIQEVTNGATQAVLNLSAATGESLETGVNAVISATRIWVADNVDAIHAVDTLTQVANATASSVKQLAGGMKNAGAVAATMGVSIDQTLDLLGALSNVGLKGPEGGTALRYFLLNLVPSTNKAIETMKELGLMTFHATSAARELAKAHQSVGATQEETLDRLYKNFAGTEKTFAQAIEDGDINVGKFQQYLAREGIITSEFVDQATGKLRDARDILQIVYDKIVSGRGQVDSQKLLSALFGERGGSKAASPLMIAFKKNLEDYNNAVKNLDNAKLSGNTEEIKKWEKALETLKPNVIDTIRAQTGKLGTAQEIGAKRMEGYAGSMKFLTSSIEAMKIRLGQPLLDSFAGIFRWLGNIVNATSDWAEKNPELVKTIGSVVAALGAFATLVSPILMVATAWPVLGAALAGFASAIIPVTAIFGIFGSVLTAVALAIGDPNSGLMPAIKGAASAFKDIFANAVALAQEVLVSVFLPAGRVILNFVLNQLLPAIVRFADGFMRILPGAINTVNNFLTTVLFPTITKLWNWFSSLLPGAISLLVGLWNNVLGPGIQNLATLLDQVVFPAIWQLWHYLETQIPSAVKVVSSVINNFLAPILRTAGIIIVGLLLPALAKIWEWVAVNLPPAMQAFAGLWNTVISPILIGAAWIITNVLVPAYLMALTYLREHLFEIAVLLGTTLIPAFIAWAAVAIPTAISVVVAFAPVILVIMAIIAVIGLLKMAWENNFIHIQDVAMAVWTVISAIWTAITEAIRKITDGLGALLGTSQQTANQVGQGIGNGIHQGMQPGLTGAVNDSKAASTSIFNNMDWMKGQSGPIGFQTGYDYRTLFGGQMQGTVDDTGHHMLDLQDVLNGQYGPIKTEADTIGQGIHDALNEQFGETLMATSRWKTLTLDTIISTQTPAGESTAAVGESLRGRLAEKLGESFANVKDWKNLTVGQLTAMIQPAGAAGYKTGYNASSGMVLGLDANIPAVIARVKFLREQLSIALDIEEKMGAIAHPTAGQDVDEFRAGRLAQQKAALAAKAAMAANKAGIPDFMLDFMAGADPMKPSGLGANNNPFGPGGNPDFGTDETNSNPYNNNINAHGDGAGGGGGGGGSTRTPAEQAADVAKKIADAIKDGVDALRRLANLHVPENLDAKAKEFAQAITKILMALQSVSLSFTDKALEHTEKFLSAAEKAVSTLDKGLDAFAKMKNFVPPTSQSIGQFMVAVRLVMAGISAAASQYSVDAIAHADLFSDAAGKAVDLIGKGVDAFSKLKGFVTPSVSAVSSLVDAINYTMTILRPIADTWAPEALEVTSQFSEAAGKVADGLGKGMDFLDKLGKNKTDFKNLSGRITELVNATQYMMNTLGPLTKGWEEFADKVANFSDAAGKVADGLGKTAEFLEKLSTNKTDFKNIAGRVTELANAAQHMMNTLGPLTVRWEGFTEKASQFADAAGKVADGLVKTEEFLDKLSTSKTDFKNLAVRVGELENATQHMMNTLGPISSSWEEFATVKVSQYADAASKVADGLGKTLDFLDKLGASKTNFTALTDRVGQLQQVIVTTMQNLSPIASSWEEFATTKISQFADASGKVADGLGKSLTLLDDLAKSKTNFSGLTSRVQELLGVLVNIVGATMKSVPDSFEAGTIPAFMDAAEKTMDAISKTYDLMTKLSEKTKFGPMSKVSELADMTVQMFRMYQHALLVSAVALNDSEVELDTITANIADQQSKVVAAIGSTFDLMVKLGQGVKNKVDPAGVFNGLLTFLLDITKQFHDVQSVFASQVSEDSANISKMIGDTVGGLSGSLDFFAKLGDFRPIANARVDMFIDGLRYVISRLKDVPSLIAPELLDAAHEFGEKLAPAFSLMSSAVDFFSKLMGHDEESTMEGKGDRTKKVGGLESIDASRIDMLIDGLRYLIGKLKDGLLNSIAPDLLDLANEFATKIGPAIDVLGKTLDIFLKLSGDGKDNKGLVHIDPDAIGELVGDLYILLHHWKNVVIGGEFQGDFIERSQAFAGVVEVVLGTISRVIEMANSLVQGEDSNQAITRLPGLIANVMQAIRQAVTIEIPAARQGFSSGYGDIAGDTEAQSDPNQQGTIAYFWDNKQFGLLWRLLAAVEGKGGLRVWLRLAFRGLMMDVGEEIGGALPGIVEGWVQAMGQMKDATIAAIEAIKSALQSVTGGSVNVNISYTGGTPIPAMAAGGFVMRPTFALIGEAGPEAVIPLNKANNYGMGGSGTVTNNYNNIRQVNVEKVTDINETKKRNRTLTDPMN